MANFWIPTYKSELITWLTRFNPHINYRRYSKKKLMNIYYAVRIKGVRFKV